MGNPRKPAQLKVLSNTDQPCRRAAPNSVVDLPLTESVPDAPDWLPNAHAVKEWQRLAPILFHNKLLTEAALTALGHLCALHGKLVQLWAAGESPTGHMMAQYRSLINDFGLTPIAQGKVKPAGTENRPGNKFAKNGKRR